MKTFSDYLTIVAFLIEHQGKDVEPALREALVPVHLLEQVRLYLAGPIDIIRADIIVNPQELELCQPLPADHPQPYTGAFLKFLLDNRGWNRTVVDTLAGTSLDLLGRIPKPDAAPKFQQRGLVIGYIQSGKTAAMAALIARAADQGYRLFIVLAGLMNDLRSQTQKRLDQEIAGRSENPRDAPFVIHEPTAAPWGRLTNSGINGDFEAGTHNDLNPLTPKLAVIKKNVARMTSLTNWLKDSQVPLSQLPALIIDDEADQASINTNYGKLDEDGEEYDPSKTNKAIRILLKTLPKCVYVGFTATPFANVLIDATVEEDLYPRDFIAGLPEPVGYFGPRQLFGLGMAATDLSPDAPEASALDVIRPLTAEQVVALDAVAAGDECPQILADALLAFVLSSSARLARGHDHHHFTMFVHPSQSTVDHGIFAGLLGKEIDMLKVAVGRPKVFPATAKRASEMWKDDFVAKTNSEPSDFDTVWKFAKGIVEAIDLKVLNYNTKEELDYSDPPKRYVVVGGNRLSRGLTLEGLSISFFTRDTNYYDTLLQMGRWFGYRPGYVDLTRIYVESSMARQFSELARVELELRADIAKYARKPNPPTPRELMPRIRSHPSLAVTSRLKMGAGKPVNISFRGTYTQTVSFPIGDKVALRHNEDAAKGFVQSMGTPDLPAADDGMYVWKNRTASEVLGFVQSYTFSKDAPEVNRDNLTKYITRMNKKRELRSWDVVVPGGNPALDPYRWAAEVIARRIMRSPRTKNSIGVLSNPGDIAEWKKKANRTGDDADLGCLMLYAIDKGSGAPKKTFFASPAEAVDIIALVFAFPDSETGVTVEYVSQQDL